MAINSGRMKEVHKSSVERNKYEAHRNIGNCPRSIHLRFGFIYVYSCHINVCVCVCAAGFSCEIPMYVLSFIFLEVQCGLRE